MTIVVAPARLETDVPADGDYELWAGRDLPAEVPNIATLLAGMGGGRNISLTLLGEARPPARWAGEPLVVSGRTRATGQLVVMSSGTTGAPKPAAQSVPRALERKRGGGPGERWLLAFAPWRWAGISVLLHCLRYDAELIVPDGLDPAALLEAATAPGPARRPDHLSLTPSVFRLLRLAAADAELAAIPLRQVTFGGEAASQATLDAARVVWPLARVTHTYASSELGDICAVSDGREGVPAAKFAAQRFTEAGELIVDGRATGDLWELRGDGPSARYHFLGRAEEMINVGGANVWPLAVEGAALAIPGVTQARARALPSPILGQLVGLEYAGEVDEDEVRSILRSELPKIAWPARLRHVPSIELSDAGKLRRTP